MWDNLIFKLLQIKRVWWALSSKLNISTSHISPLNGQSVTPELSETEKGSERVGIQLPRLMACQYWQLHASAFIQSSPRILNTLLSIDSQFTYGSLSILHNVINVKYQHYHLSSILSKSRTISRKSNSYFQVWFLLKAIIKIRIYHGKYLLSIHNHHKEN